MLHSGLCSSEMTGRNRKRKQRAYHYSFEGQTVCAAAFRYAYHLGSRVFRNLQLHLEKHGVTPRVKGNTGRKPHHALSFPEVENCAKFIKRFAELHGLLRCMEGMVNHPLTYLLRATTR